MVKESVKLKLSVMHRVSTNSMKNLDGIESIPGALKGLRALSLARMISGDKLISDNYFETFIAHFRIYELLSSITNTALK